MLKKILFLFIAIVVYGFNVTAQTQEFAPMGATWWYDQIQKYPPYDISYWRFESKSDTIISGLDLRLIQTDFITETSDFTDTFYLQVDSGIISVYDPEFDVLAPYFNFNAVVGDSLICTEGMNMDDAASIVIDSIHMVTIAGEDLKEFYFHNTFETDYYLGGWTFTERIGNSGFFFPQFGAADPPPGGPLRCYEDDVIGLYGATDISECDFIAGVKYENVGQLNIYPNPADDVIYLSGIFSHEMEIVFTDLVGKKYFPDIKAINNDLRSISLTTLPSGIYFISVFENGNLSGTKKLIRR